MIENNSSKIAWLLAPHNSKYSNKEYVKDYFQLKRSESTLFWHEKIAKLKYPTAVQQEGSTGVKNNKTALNQSYAEVLDKKNSIGKIGENTALEYLKSIHGDKDVILVSDDAVKGYDIEIFDGTNLFAYEIKTSSGKQEFHMTRNEITVASTMLNDYNLFFETVTIKPDQFLFEFNDNYLSHIQSVDLTNTTIILNYFNSKE